MFYTFNSVQFSHSSCLTFCNPMGVQGKSLPCPLPTPGAYSNSCPLSQGCHPTLSSSVLPFFSCFKSFSESRSSSESKLHIRWPKYWSFSFSIHPSNEYSGPTPFRIDWLDLLAVQGTPKSLLQNHSSKVSVLQGSAFFIVQLSHESTTTQKTIALIRWTLLAK